MKKMKLIILALITVIIISGCTLFKSAKNSLKLEDKGDPFLIPPFTRESDIIKLSIFGDYDYFNSSKTRDYADMINKYGLKTDSPVDVLPFKVDPKMVFVNANPGDKKIIDLIITKEAGFEDSFLVEPADLIHADPEYQDFKTKRYESETGYLVIKHWDYAEPEPYSLKSWMKVPLTKTDERNPFFDLYADQFNNNNYNFPLELDIPEDITPGDYFGILSIELVGLNGIVNYADILVVVRVSNPQDKIEIESFFITDSFDGETTAVLAIKNLGNTVCELDGYLEVNGQKRSLLNIIGHSPMTRANFILPGGHITYFDWHYSFAPPEERVLEIGKKYELKGIFKCGDSPAVQESVKFKPKKQPHI